MTFYNGNLDYYMALTFIFEFTLGGTVIPSTRLALLNQVMWDTEAEKNLPATITEFGTYLFVGTYFVQQCIVYYRVTRRTANLAAYFYDVWNLLEFTVLAGFFFSLYTRVNLFTQLKPPEVIFEPAFYDFSTIARLYTSSFYIDSVCVIALFFKSFKCDPQPPPSPSPSPLSASSRSFSSRSTRAILCVGTFAISGQWRTFHIRNLAPTFSMPLRTYL